MNSNKIIKYIKDLFISIKSISNNVIYINRLNIKTLYYSSILIYSFIINISFISNSYAGGGGSSSPPDKCNASNVNNDAYCEPYSPSLPSWNNIEVHEYSNNDVDFDIKVPMTSNSSGYVILDKEYSDQLLRENGSCNTDDGAERFIVSNAYMKSDKHIRGKYCSSFRVGIEKRYLDTVPDTTYIDHSKLKIFCNSTSSINDSISPISSDDTLSNGSYLSYSNNFICRDGIIRSGNPSCSIVTRYAVKWKTEGCFSHKDRDCLRYGSAPCEEYGESPAEECVKGCEEAQGWMPLEGFTGCLAGCRGLSRERSCTSYGDPPCRKYGPPYNVYKDCYVNDSSYDTEYRSFKTYSGSICTKPVIKKIRNGINIEHKYDPNLIYE